jgi:4'-phosphopantetheinyl transferase
MTPMPLVSCATPEELADRARRDHYLAILSPGEKRRMARLLSQPKQDLFLLAHGLLRTELSRYTGFQSPTPIAQSPKSDCPVVDPAAWRFKTAAHGRPEIAAPKSPLRFNLSHTQGLAACAVTNGCDVGIDVENITRKHSPRLAERVFSRRELKTLRGLPAGEQARRFFELWTLKEAYLKARGLGLMIPLKTFSFYRDDRDEAGEWRIEFRGAPDQSWFDRRRWTFRSWRIGVLHQAALAVSVDDRPDKQRPDADDDPENPVLQLHVGSRLGADKRGGQIRRQQTDDRQQ